MTGKPGEGTKLMSTRPETLRYREALDTAEQRIVDALPEIIDVLIN